MGIPVKRTGDICGYAMFLFLKASFSHISWLPCIILTVNQRSQTPGTEETGYIKLLASKWQLTLVDTANVYCRTFERSNIQ